MAKEFDDDMPDFFEDFIMNKDGKPISIEAYHDQQAKPRKDVSRQNLRRPERIKTRKNRGRYYE